MIELSEIVRIAKTAHREYYGAYRIQCLVLSAKIKRVYPYNILYYIQLYYKYLQSDKKSLTVSVKESLPIIIGLVAGIFIIILLLIVCCLCCCRRRSSAVQSKKTHANGFTNGDVPNHHAASLVSEPSEQQKSLLAVVNPVQKPPRRYESSPTGTEMTELKRNLLDETSISG